MMKFSKTSIAFFKGNSRKGRKPVREGIAPILPTECMQKIFKYIQDCDTSSKLYSSLLVNRYWSKNVVPFIWSRPFQLCSKQNRYKLINTLLMFFSLEETELINSKLRAYNIIIPARPNPIFNYIAMIREIHYLELENFVSSYLKKVIFIGANGMYQQVQISFITGSLFQTFLRQSINLETLIIDKEIYTMDLPDISIFTESNSNLLNLSNLKIDYNNNKILNMIQFLNYISGLCHNIQNLEFKFNINAYNNDELLKSISKTIRAQNELRKFNLSNVKRTGIESVMMSLLIHDNTLTSITLAFIKLNQTIMNILLSLSQLKKLKLCYCEGLNNYNFTHNLNLDTLHLVDLSTDLKLFKLIIQSILQSTGNSIKQLGFNIEHIESLNIALNYCPNLDEIILYYLSKKNQSNKLVNKIINRLEKSWKEELSLLPFYNKEISLKTIIYH
ncbi:hypothetical protein RclHR1_01720006 [Rhizophagus clarus]|uniref:F-box domain-containing protein n=1 Tax=Rhizophagus clarus TaxID=94130 RepID=A0A2Z6QKV1_9GLOM|nr:hypothetical protein RclHR1_01720006 [Rhizophagus clarus]